MSNIYHELLSLWASVSSNGYALSSHWLCGASQYMRHGPLPSVIFNWMEALINY